jgi:hypothetical protein
MAFLDPVNTVTTKEIVPGVADGVFRNSPTLAMFKKNSLEPWQGGPSYQENLLYGVLPIEAYTPGDTFTLTSPQIATGGTVLPRYYSVNVVAQLEKLKIEMAGPRAVFSHIDLLLQNAALTMSGRLSNDIFRDGQQATRAKFINGMDESLSDGTTTGFQGVTFANYLTLPRTSVDGALNSPMTSPAANVAGPISHPILEQAFSSVTIGLEKPDLIVTSNNGFSFIKLAFAPLQRFETSDPELGFQTIAFNGAKIVADQYCPGSRVATAADTALGYTAIAGETIWLLNTKQFRFYLSTDPLFGFGFTGFLPAQDSSVVAGRYHFMGNFTCQAPRLSRYLFGVTA